MTLRSTAAAGLGLVAGLLATACGSSTTPKASSTAANPGSITSTSPASTPTTPTTTSAASPATGPSALSAEANATATGDIPDNQVFLVFTNKPAGYAMKYPEGWTQNGPARRITFSDKNNLVRVVIANGSKPTVASVTQQLQTLKRSTHSLTFTSARPISLPAGPAVAATYVTQSAPDPVTGKRVTLIVNRYVVARGNRVATVDLGTPKGVDNVDAYRKMIQSLRWL
jgi:hypothetical protein